MSARSGERITSIPPGLEEERLTTRDLTRQTFGARLDPFLIVSRFRMMGPVFPPHPHAGFAVMTYILPESETGFRNQDSSGFSNIIAPGELHLTLAGRGIQHEETNVEAGRAALGFQIWIDLSAGHRQDAPSSIHLTAARVPVIEASGATVRVLAGSSNGATSPLTIPTAFRLVDVTLGPDARFEQDLSSAETAFVVMVSGSATIADEPARADEVIFTGREGDRLTLDAGPQGARFMLFAGEPLGQEPVFGGPFVASDANELSAFKRAYSTGAMGTLTAFADQDAMP